MNQHTFISWRPLKNNNQPIAHLGQIAGSRSSQILWYGDAPILEMPQHHQIGTLRLVGRIQGRTCWVEEATVVAALGELPPPPINILRWIYQRISPALDFLHHSGIGYGSLSPFGIGISETGDPILIGVTGTSTPETDRAYFMHMWNSVSEHPTTLSAEPLHRLLPNQPNHAEALLQFTQQHRPKGGHTLRELQIDLLHHIHTPQLDEFDKEPSVSESTVNRLEHTLSQEHTADLLLNKQDSAPIPNIERGALSRLSDWLHRDCESITFDASSSLPQPQNIIRLEPLLPPNGVLIASWPQYNVDNDWENTATLMVTQSKTQHSVQDFDEQTEHTQPTAPKKADAKAYLIGAVLTFSTIILGYFLSSFLKSCL